MDNKIYDTIVVGAGPAALSASLYASRYFLKHLVIGKILGGVMGNAYKIENYPGIETTSGNELAQKIAQQVRKLGAEIRNEEVKKITKNKKGYFEILTDGSSANAFQSQTVILATGMERRTLKIPGEKEFSGKGVSYCSTCDGAFFKDKVVAVVGGSSAAAMAAVHLSSYAKKVYVIYRKSALRGEPTWNKRVEDTGNIEIIFNTNILEIKGTSRVEKVILDNPYNGGKEIKLDGVFIEAGHVPTKAIAEKLGIKMTKEGFIKINPAQETNVLGVLAAGDITNGSNNFRQVVTAVAEGAIAAKTAFDLKMRSNKNK